ncbi:MAG TPA: choice-of-anchor D domain-containing protein, partial [Verrucomicrobiae bacterium]|nr:choice-of-anchor D domain-containing protein [Verrucomicrobiae bacterium]
MENQQILRISTLRLLFVIHALFLPLLRAAERGGQHTFSTPETVLAQEAYLKAFNTAANDHFGSAVAISGDTLVIGAPQESNHNLPNGPSLANSGAAYVFSRVGTTWAQQAYLKAFNADAQDRFGATVAISGDTIVIGAPSEDSNGTGIGTFVEGANNDAADSGAAYIYIRQGTNWILQAYIKASNTGTLDHFGESVAVDGEKVVIGASGEDSNAVGVNGTGTNSNGFANSGAAYVFARTGNGWSQEAYLKAPLSRQKVGYNFGRSVSIWENLIVIGAPGEASDALGVDGDQISERAPQSGAAYIFAYRNGLWSHDAYLKASNTQPEARFGYSVGVSSNRVVVGSPSEKSPARGVNDYAHQNDTSALTAGAAYVFSRNATGWTQQAYLKASNTDPFDGFGGAVSISGDTVVVGADGEDSNATGINGDEQNTQGSNSGAAYVFIYTGFSWVQKAYLKASNNEPLGLGAMNDFFGAAVAVSQGTIVAGALSEDSQLTGVNQVETDPPFNLNFNSGAAYVFSGFGPLGTPQIVVEQPAGAPLTNATASLDFGAVSFRTNSALPLVIKNVGRVSLTITNIAITGPAADEFSVVGNSLSFVLTPGSSRAFNLLFRPGTSVGTRSALLHVFSNDPDESSFDIILSGLALPPPEGLTIVSDHLVYPFLGGNVLVDDSATLRISNVVNWATSTLEVSLQPLAPREDKLFLR